MTDDVVPSLRWTAWMPLMGAHPLALAQLPSPPGFYRIRRAHAPAGMLWIGWDARGVRETMERLSRQVHLPLPPYDDPAVPALRLWTLRRSEGMAFEVSGAPADLSADDVAPILRTLRNHYGLAEYNC